MSRSFHQLNLLFQFLQLLECNVATKIFERNKNSMGKIKILKYTGATDEIDRYYY